MGCWDIIRSFLGHDHTERNHQGLGNELIVPVDRPPDIDAEIETTERLGGLLRSYRRAAECIQSSLTPHHSSLIASGDACCVVPPFSITFWPAALWLYSISTQNRPPSTHATAGFTGRNIRSNFLTPRARKIKHISSCACDLSMFANQHGYFHRLLSERRPWKATFALPNRRLAWQQMTCIAESSVSRVG